MGRELFLFGWAFGGVGGPIKPSIKNNARDYERYLSEGNCYCFAEKLVITKLTSA